MFVLNLSLVSLSFILITWHSSGAGYLPQQVKAVAALLRILNGNRGRIRLPKAEFNAIQLNKLYSDRRSSGPKPWVLIPDVEKDAATAAQPDAAIAA